MKNGWMEMVNSFIKRRTSKEREKRTINTEVIEASSGIL